MYSLAKFVQLRFLDTAGTVLLFSNSYASPSSSVLHFTVKMLGNMCRERKRKHYEELRRRGMA